MRGISGFKAACIAALVGLAFAAPPAARAAATPGDGTSTNATSANTTGAKVAGADVAGANAAGAADAGATSLCGVAPKANQGDVAATGKAPPTAAQEPKSAPIQLVVLCVDKSAKILQAHFDGDDSKLTLAVGDKVPRSRLNEIEPGDVIYGSADAADAPKQLLEIKQLFRPVDFQSRVVALSLVAIALFLLAALVTKGRPQCFAIGVDNRYSNSQVQLVLWFGVLSISYAAAVALRVVFLHGDYIGGVGITANLAALSGLSALSFGSAKAITVGKLAAKAAKDAEKADKAAKEAAAKAPTGDGADVPDPAPADEASGTATDPGAAAAAQDDPQKKKADKAHFFADLFCNDDGRPDLGDFQMVLITVAAAGIYLFQIFHFLGRLELAASVTLPDIDTTLLASFGIGQGAYLAKKAATDPGEG